MRVHRVLILSLDALERKIKDIRMIMWIVVLVVAVISGGLVYLLMQKQLDRQVTQVSDALKATQQQLIGFSDQYRQSQKILNQLKHDVEAKNVELLDVIEENRKLSRQGQHLSQNHQQQLDKFSELEHKNALLEEEKQELIERLKTSMNEFHQLKLSKEAMFKDVAQMTEDYLALKEKYENLVQHKNDSSSE